MAQFTASMERPDLMERLAEIKCPVLIVGAASDQLVDPADLHEMQRHLPDARLHIHDGTGHMIPLEAPQALATDILAFHQTT
nr:alpha/beta hydrolase [Duganella vulcania]